MSKKLFKGFQRLEDSFKNNICNYVNTGKSTKFILYKLIIRQFMMYENFLEYLDLQLSAKCDHLYITKS